MKNWKLKFAWTPKQVRTDRRIWLKPYYEAVTGDGIYRREKGSGMVYKITLCFDPTDERLVRD